MDAVSKVCVCPPRNKMVIFHINSYISLLCVCARVCACAQLLSFYWQGEDSLPHLCWTTKPRYTTALWLWGRNVGVIVLWPQWAPTLRAGPDPPGSGSPLSGRPAAPGEPSSLAPGPEAQRGVLLTLSLVTLECTSSDPTPTRDPFITPGTRSLRSRRSRHVCSGNHFHNCNSFLFWYTLNIFIYISQLLSLSVYLHLRTFWMGSHISGPKLQWNSADCLLINGKQRYFISQK